MNIYDISKEANVSTATVSRVLNGNAKVSEKTRAAVMEVIERHGYQPSALARGLSPVSYTHLPRVCIPETGVLYLQGRTTLLWRKMEKRCIISGLNTLPERRILL